MCDSQDVWLIDPAVYYADSEVDIAMTEMFGGFSNHFYEGYESQRRLSSEYRNKSVLYNLYHYLNHFNLFGSSYQQACEKGLVRLKQIVSS